MYKEIIANNHNYKIIALFVGVMHRKRSNPAITVTTPNTNPNEEENQNIEYDNEPLLRQETDRPTTSSYGFVNN
jgi:hypothetical protein